MDKHAANQIDIWKDIEANRQMDKHPANQIDKWTDIESNRQSTVEEL